jgi:signal transduction histidine kinase
VIVFSDNGCGISPTIENSIFDSGFSGFGSTGQGLTQAKEDIGHFGGRIFLQESLPEKKTTFVIELLEIDS